MHRCACLGADLSVATYQTDRADAWRLIKDTGGQVSLAVPIEMAMGHGMPPIQEALDHGVRPSLSSDVDVTMAQDAFTLMRSTFTLQRLNVWPLNNAPGAVVNLMNPTNVDSVFIAGKVRKWRGSLVGVDVARVLRLVEEARDAVVRRAGFAMNLLG